MDIRREPWVPSLHDCRPVWREGNHAFEDIRLVVDLALHDNGQWNQALFREIFVEESTEAILKMPPPRSLHLDQWIWTSEASSLFSIKAFLRADQDFRAPEALCLDMKSWNFLWKLKIQDS